MGRGIVECIISEEKKLRKEKEMGKVRMIRQGDVLLVARAAVPAGATLEERCVLAYGEATGHAHEVEGGARIWVDLNDKGRRYLEITDIRAELRHQEHGSIELFKEQQPVYEIIRQVEYTAQAVRHVSD